MASFQPHFHVQLLYGVGLCVKRKKPLFDDDLIADRLAWEIHGQSKNFGMQPVVYFPEPYLVFIEASIKQDHPHGVGILRLVTLLKRHTSKSIRESFDTCLPTLWTREFFLQTGTPGRIKTSRKSWEKAFAEWDLWIHYDS